MHEKLISGVTLPFMNMLYSLHTGIFQLVSLTLDGLTGATQDRMRSEHKTGPYHMMLNVNLWSVVWLAIGKYNSMMKCYITMC